tara:strand:+ start:1301 stop:1966 length:666 start_codon:yes stop_codon:yes gene_type:complete
MKARLLICTFFVCFWASAQDNILSINFNEIKFKKVKEFINQQKANKIIQFIDVKGSYNEAENKTYKKHHQSYLILKPLDEVWANYKSTSPAQSWNGKMLNFGCLISKKSNRVSYKSDAYQGAEVGQVFYVNLKLLKGLYNLAVAFEVTRLSEENHTIEYSYVHGGKTQGKQWMEMTSTPEGYTRISHFTLYKSASEFRDVLIYPYVHELAITEFHQNMLNQ